MDPLTFISKLIESLAWPGVVVAALLLFRGGLTELIPLLRRLKYKEFELDFERRLERLQQQVEPGAPEPARSDAPAQLLNLARAAPRVGVIAAWLELEEELVKALGRRGFTLTDQQRFLPERLIRAAISAQLIPENIARALRDLAELRNKALAAPDASLTADLAVQYASLAADVAAKLREQV